MRVGWGIVGAGHAARSFITGLEAAPGERVAALCSGRLARAEAAAAEFRIATVHDNVAALVADPSVDRIYIASPASLHLVHAEMALSAGKPTLIEKPLAASTVEAQRIQALAAAHGVFCMEAMWTRFLPMIATLRDTLAEPDTGQVRSWLGSFGAPASSKRTALFDPAMGGGALWHRGIYSVSLALHLLGAASLAGAVVRRGDSGVDEDATMLLRHDGGVLSTHMASLATSLPGDVRIEAERRSIHIHAPIYRPFATRMRHVPSVDSNHAGDGGLRARLRQSPTLQWAQQRFQVSPLAALRRRGEALHGFYAGNGYHYQAEEIRRCVTQGMRESPIMPLDESVAAIALIEQALAAQG